MVLKIHNIAEISSAFICTICVLYKPSYINRWFVWFLWLTVCVELTGKMTVNYPLFKLSMYNVFTAIEFIFYSLFLIKNVSNDTLIKIIKFGILIFIAFFITNFSFLQKPFIYNTYTATFSGVLLIFFCLLYFYSTLFSDNETNSRWSKFLIVSSIFIFYAGSFRVYASFNSLAKKLPKDLSDIYNLITNNLNVVLYGLFIVAFITEIVQTKTEKDTITLPN